MNINDLYPSKYLKSDDIGNQRITLQVGAIKLEEVAAGEPAKPIMYFNGKEKGVVLNKTNALLCAHCWGNDTDTWTGQWLDLFVEPKMFQGKVVNGLSVAPKLANSNSGAQQPETPNAAPAAPQAPEPAAAVHGQVDPIDDIPF